MSFPREIFHSDQPKMSAAERRRLINNLERKIGKFYADNENDATDHLHLPPDIAEAQKKLRQLKGPDAPDWRIPIWAEAENVLSAHGADAANDFLAANGLDPQY